MESLKYFRSEGFLPGGIGCGMDPVDFNTLPVKSLWIGPFDPKLPPFVQSYLSYLPASVECFQGDDAVAKGVMSGIFKCTSRKFKFFPDLKSFAVCKNELAGLMAFASRLPIFIDQYPGMALQGLVIKFQFGGVIPCITLNKQEGRKDRDGP